MSFKFFRGDILEFNTINSQLTLRQPEFDRSMVEFCFQFDDGEPRVFGMGPNDLHIHVSPTPNGNITFTNDERTFKIFARERQ